MDDRPTQDDPLTAAVRLDTDAVGESREHPAQTNALVLTLELGHELAPHRAEAGLKPFRRSPKDDPNGVALALPSKQLGEGKLPILERFDCQIEASGKPG
jgi:hypothetical protein